VYSTFKLNITLKIIKLHTPTISLSRTPGDLDFHTAQFN